MAEVQKIDANVTTLAVSREASPGVLAGSSVFRRQRPNSYGDFGGQITLVAPNPISAAAMEEEGTPTDLNASANWNTNLDQVSLRDFWDATLASVRSQRPQHGGLGSGDTLAVTATGYDIGEDAAAAGYAAPFLIYAENFAIAGNNGLKLITGTSLDEVQAAGLTIEAVPPAGAKITVVGYQPDTDDIDVDVSGDLPQLTSGNGVGTQTDFTDWNVAPGDWIYRDGVSDPENSGLMRIASVSAAALTIDRAPTTADMVAETNTGTVQFFFGDTVKNEYRDTSSFLEASFHVERSLGEPSPVGGAGEIQSENLSGCFLNTLTVNIPTSDLVNVDLGFLAFDHQTHAGTVGDPRPSDAGSIVNLEQAQPFNSTNDVLRNEMAILPVETSPDATPVRIADSLTEATLSLGLNGQTTKRIGTFGAFGVVLGTFTFATSVTVYFEEVSQVQAVRNSTRVGWTIGFAKEFNGRRAGVLIDVPLGKLGEGRLNVAQNQAITLPLSHRAARHGTLDYAVKITEFWYLPDA